MSVQARSGDQSQVINKENMLIIGRRAFFFFNYAQQQQLSCVAGGNCRRPPSTHDLLHYVYMHAHIMVKVFTIF